MYISIFISNLNKYYSKIKNIPQKKLNMKKKKSY